MNMRLKMALAATGEPAWKIASRAGIPDTILSMIVRSRRAPTADQQRAIAEALGKSVDELFGEAATSTAPKTKAVPSAKRLLSVKAAAAELGVSAWTLRDLIGAGQLPVVKFPGVRRIFIDRKDLDELIDRSKERFT